MMPTLTRCCVVVLSCAAWVAACKDPFDAKGSGKKAASAPLPAMAGFLTATDLGDPGNLSPYTAAQLAAEINGSSDFFNLAPPEPPKNDCFTEALVGQKVRGSKDGHLSMNIDRSDLAPCMQSLQTKGYQYSSVKVRLSVAFQCPGADMSQFDGMTFRAFKSRFEREKLICNVDQRSLTEMRVAQVYSAVLETGQQMQFSMDYANRQGLENGAPCRLPPTNSTKAIECGSVDRNKIITQPATQEPMNSFNQFMNVNLVGSSSGTYYQAGSIKFVMNGWQGSMVYNGTTKAPTWTATSAQGERAQGTFAYTSSSLALAEEEPINLVKRLREIQPRLLNFR